jgi:hypothetical protein
MRHLIFLMFIGGAMLAGSACDDSIEKNELGGGGTTPVPEVPDEVRAACARLCELTNKLMCDPGGPVNCTEGEADSWACDLDEITRYTPWCRTELVNAALCIQVEQELLFECINGVATLKDNACTMTKPVLESCLREGPTNGVPDQAEACTELCNKQAGLSCAQPDCLQRCLDRTADAGDCNSAEASFLRCSVQDMAANAIWTCDEMTNAAILQVDGCQGTGELRFGCCFDNATNCQGT